MSLFSADALSSAPVRTLINPGKYQVRVEKAEQIISSQKKTPGLGLTFDIVMGPIQENNSDPAGRKLFSNIFSSHDPDKRGMFYSRVHAIADAIGFDLAAYAGMSEEEFTALFLANLIQKELVVTVVNKPDDKGNLREEITGFSAL